MAHSSVRLIRTAPLVALATLAACTVPNFKGPQVQEPPSGFLRNDDSWQQRRMFPDLESTMHSAWIKSTDGPYSAIYVNGHAGPIELEDIVLAQELRQAAVEDPVTFGQVETMEVDGRTAWGWEERLQTPERGLDWVAYRTVVNYDTVAYAIEFYSGDPRIKPLSPDTLRAVIATFAVGRTTWNLPLIGLGLALLVLAVQFMRSRSQKETDRLRSIHLVQVPKKDDEEAGGRDPMGAPAHVGRATEGTVPDTSPLSITPSPTRAASTTAAPARPTSPSTPTASGGPATTQRAPSPSPGAPTRPATTQPGSRTPATAASRATEQPRPPKQSPTPPAPAARPAVQSPAAAGGPGQQPAPAAQRPSRPPAPPASPSHISRTKTAEDQDGEDDPPSS